VSARLSDVQVEAPLCSLQEVRCLACHAVYEQPQETGALDTSGCPDCGAVFWLAATIPLAESEAPREAWDYASFGT
jgi:predicted  nucleic acid-binding Zn-ribbon protein